MWLGRLWPMCAWWGWCPRGARGPSGARGARGGRGPSRIGRNCLSHGWSVLWTLSVYLADRVYTRLTRCCAAFA